MLRKITSQKIACLTFVLFISLVFVGSSFAGMQIGPGEIARGQLIGYSSFVETQDGVLHCAYAEGLELKYAVSTDSEKNWTIDTIPTPTAYYFQGSWPGIRYCQLAIDSNGSVYILYCVNTYQDTQPYSWDKLDLYCSTNISGSWQYELVKEAWHNYPGYGYVELYLPEDVIVDYQDKVHLFARKAGWWFYGSPLHELVRQSDGTWNDITVVHIKTGHPDYITMWTPRASIGSTGKISVTFVNPYYYRETYGTHDLNLIEGDSDQAWGSYVTKSNDATYSASVIDAQDNLHVVYVGADGRSVKYMKNWGDVEVITIVEPPLAIYNPDIHVDAYGNVTAMARTYDTEGKVTTDVWYANKPADGVWSEPQPMPTDFEPSKWHGLQPSDDENSQWWYGLNPHQALVRGSVPGVYTSPKAVCVYNVDDETRALVFMELGESTSLYIFNIYPNHGLVCGGTQVVLKGDNFQEGATVSIGGSELIDVTVFPEVAASVTSQSIDITDVAPNDVTLSITLKEKFIPEVMGSITFPTDSTVVANILVLKAFIEISIANSPELAGKIIVSVDGVDSAVAVTFTTVDKGTGVQLNIEQISGSDILFSTVVSDEGNSVIIGTTSLGTLGLHDVVVTNPDGESDTLAHAFVYMPLVGDVSGNCEITAYDAALILQYVIGLIDQFPADSPIAQAAQKYISGEVSIDELDRILQKWGYPSVFKLLGFENQLLQNFPNPFNPDTWLPYQLAQDAPVTIYIYNAKGLLICTLHLGYQPAGRYMTKDNAAYWDGRCSLGEKVASGVYYYTLQAGEFSATRKMVILK